MIGKWFLNRFSEKQVFLFALIFFLILPLIVSNHFIITEILAYAIFGISFNLMLGNVGLLSFGHALYFGSGAYTMALLLIHCKANMFLGILAGMGMAGVFAFAVGFLSIRQYGVYFSMLTLSFAEMVYFIALRLRDITGGENGLSIVRPPLQIPGLVSVSLESPLKLYYFVFFFFLLVLMIMRRLVDSPFGRVLQIIRENETRARTLGYNVERFKLTAFIISGLFSGLAGTLYCLIVKFVHCGDLQWLKSGDVVIMTLIGGTSSLYGPIIGAIINTFLSDLISLLWQRWLLILGIIFVVFVLFMREGVWGEIKKGIAEKM
jgi:branched-chain amino acid transport system permease protein